jgi:hypothetical protein
VNDEKAFNAVQNNGVGVVSLHLHAVATRNRFPAIASQTDLCLARRMPYSIHISYSLVV